MQVNDQSTVEKACKGEDEIRLLFYLEFSGPKDKKSNSGRRTSVCPLRGQAAYSVLNPEKETKDSPVRQWSANEANSSWPLLTASGSNHICLREPDRQ